MVVQPNLARWGMREGGKLKESVRDLLETMRKCVPLARGKIVSA
jgi:hypothetical protein